MERAAIYRADSRNKWTDSNPSGQLDLLLKGLEVSPHLFLLSLLFSLYLQATLEADQIVVSRCSVSKSRRTCRRRNRMPCSVPARLASFVSFLRLTIVFLPYFQLRSTSHRGVEERNRQSSRLACNNGSPQRSGRFDPFRSIYGRLLGYWRWVARYDWIEGERPSLKCYTNSNKIF